MRKSNKLLTLLVWKRNFFFTGEYHALTVHGLCNYGQVECQAKNSLPIGFLHVKHMSTGKTACPTHRQLIPTNGAHRLVVAKLRHWNFWKPATISKLSAHKQNASSAWCYHDITTTSSSYHMLPLEVPQNWRKTTKTKRVKTPDQPTLLEDSWSVFGSCDAVQSVVLAWCRPCAGAGRCTVWPSWRSWSDWNNTTLGRGMGDRVGLEYMEKWEMEEMVNRINSMHSSQTQAMYQMTSHHTMITQDDTMMTSQNTMITQDDTMMTSQDTMMTSQDTMMTSQSILLTSMCMWWTNRRPSNAKSK